MVMTLMSCYWNSAAFERFWLRFDEISALADAVGLQRRAIILRRFRAVSSLLAMDVKKHCRKNLTSNLVH